MFPKKNENLPSPSKCSHLYSRRILEYKNSLSKSFPLFSNSSQSSSSHWLPSPNLLRKSLNYQRENLITNSQWTKIRHSLDFIRKAKQRSRENTVRRSRSLQFLGKLYAENSRDEEAGHDLI